MGKLQCSVVGGTHPNVRDEDNPSVFLSDEAVQDAVIYIAREMPRREALYGTYREVAAKIDNLLRVGALKAEGGRVYLDFTVFLREDNEVLLDAGKEYGGHLAAAVAAKAGRIRDILGAYRSTPASRDKVAFLAIGFLILDVGSLHALQSWGYMCGPKEQTGGRYTLWANEKADLDLTGVYWGGHTSESDGLCFISFGDHARLPRKALPDAFGRAFQMTPYLDSQETRALVRAYRDTLAADVARVVRSAAPGTGAAERAGVPASVPAKEIRDWLAWLGYLKDGVLSVPYFSLEEKPVLEELDALLFPEVRSWCERYYDAVKAAVKDTTPLRHGVDYPEVFRQVWHYVFGMANKRLAEMGLIFDTYREGYNTPGCVAGVAETDAIGGRHII